MIEQGNVITEWLEPRDVPTPSEGQRQEITGCGSVTHSPWTVLSQTEALKGNWLTKVWGPKQGASDMSQVSDGSESEI